jgi:hypothetical protein
VLLTGAPEAIARVGGGSLERSVFAFSFGIALLAGIGFGVAPNGAGDAAGSRAVLRRSAGAPAEAAVKHARNVLVVYGAGAGIAGGAGLLLRSFERLRSVDLGVQASHVMTFGAPAGGTLRSRRPRSVPSRFQTRLAALPGVRARRPSRVCRSGVITAGGRGDPTFPPSRVVRSHSNG